MVPSTRHNRNYRIYFWLLIAIVGITALFAYLSDLDADPPMYFDGQSQSLSTDPHHYSYSARNKLLFDQWELFDSARWRVFEATLISGLSYTLFSLFGISRTVANIPGPLTVFLSIALFLLALRRHLKLEAVAVILIMLLFNKVFYVYGRLPYTENGMLLFMAALFYIFMNYRHRLWGCVTVGLLAALAALAGKILGIMIIIPVILTLWLENRPDRIKQIVTVLISTVSLGVFWILLFYGGSLSSFFGYYQSQTVGLYGFPDALKSPLAFFEKLINFGNDSRFYFHAPVLGAAGFLGLVTAVKLIRKKINDQHIPMVFLAIWFAAGVLLFMPENYRPLRYIYMLYLPLAGLFGLMLSSSYTEENNPTDKKHYIRLTLLLFLFWVLIEQAVFNLFFIGHYNSKAGLIVWLSLIPALLITCLEYRFNFLRILKNRLFLRIVGITAVVLVLVNFGLPYRDWQQRKSFNIKEAAVDLGQILGKNAVICGPIAPSMLLENKLRGNIYAVGVTDNDPRFFAENPITHFVIDAMASGHVLNKYEKLMSAIEITDYYIRDAKILVVDVSRLTGNEQAALYQPTDYEIARSYMKQKAYESALLYMERFIKQYPDNKSALKTLGDLYPLNGRPDEAMAYLKRAESLYPTDFIVKLSLAVYYQKRFVASGDDRFRHLARETYEQVIEINPYQADEVTEISRRIAGMR